MNFSALFSAFLASLFVSFVSLVGLFSVLLAKRLQIRLQFYFISFAAGAFLANSFLQLIPEAYEEIGDLSLVLILVLVGIVIFFLIEKFICWRHCHITNEPKHKHSLAYMNIFGDLIHNFLDGMAIGASFLISFFTGLKTTLSIVFHEVPQELSDFNILLYSGFSVKKAVIYNLLTAFSAVLGVIFLFTLAGRFEHLASYLLPVTAGGFIYIATSDLIPELHKSVSLKDSLLQLFLICLGIFVIILL